MRKPRSFEATFIFRHLAFLLAPLLVITPAAAKTSGLREYGERLAFHSTAYIEIWTDFVEASDPAARREAAERVSLKALELKRLVDQHPAQLRANKLSELQFNAKIRAIVAAASPAAAGRLDHEDGACATLSKTSAGLQTAVDIANATLRQLRASQRPGFRLPEDVESTHARVKCLVTSTVVIGHAMGDVADPGAIGAMIAACPQ